MLVNSYPVSSLLDAFSLAPDFKISLRFPSERRFLSKTEEQPMRQFKSFTKPDTSTTKDPKGKSVIGVHLNRVLRVLGVLGVRVLVTLLPSVPLGLFL